MMEQNSLDSYICNIFQHNFYVVKCSDGKEFSSLRLNFKNLTPLPDFPHLSSKSLTNPMENGNLTIKMKITELLLFHGHHIQMLLK